MSPLAQGRRALLLATLAVAALAASLPSVAAASEPGALNCTLPERAGKVSGITLCHEGFEIQTRAAAPKAVVVLIGANDYGLVEPR